MKTLLVLNIPPALEDDMVDYLLGLQDVRGFTSFIAQGHGGGERLTVTEQVSGRRKRVQFEIIVEAELADRIIAGLSSSVGKDIAYWQLPVSGIGHT
jgi:hypothetical protein